MTIKDNFSITQLFVDQTITIYVDEYQSFELKARPVKDFFNDKDWYKVFYFLTENPVNQYPSFFPQENINTFLEFLRILFFKYGYYKEYKDIIELFNTQLLKILPEFNVDYKDKLFYINDVILTEEICNYLVYLLKFIQGEKNSKPPIFSSPEVKALYEAQQAQAKKIQALKDQNGINAQYKDGILKMCLVITYFFPSMTIDYLLNQTMAQILWLNQYAAKAISYEVDAQAFAAGNMKKGKKLTFFIS